MKQYIVNFFEEFDYPQEARTEVLKTFDKVKANSALWGIICEYIEEYTKKRYFGVG